MENVPRKKYKLRALPATLQPNALYYIKPIGSEEVFLYTTDKNGIPKELKDETGSGSGITNLFYTASPTQGIVVSNTGTDAIIPLADNTNAGLLSPAEKNKIQNSLESGDNTSSLVNNGSDGSSVYVEQDELSTVAFTGDYDDLSNKPSIVTNLSTVYNPSNIIIESSTGTDAILNLADGSIAGLSQNNFTTFEKNNLANQSGVNTGDQDLSSFLIKTNNLSDLSNVSTARINLGLGTLATQNGSFSGTSSGTNTGDETTSSIQTKRPLKTINSTSLEGSGNITVKGTQIFHWWGGNWNTPTLGNYYYISFNNSAIEGLNTTISASMNGRNKGLSITPFDCKIKRVMFKEEGSGSYTGFFVLASGLPNYGGTWNNGYTNVITHLNSSITSLAFNQNKFEYNVTDNIVVPKGYAVCPMMVFSAQASTSKLGIEISVEIEEV